MTAPDAAPTPRDAGESFGDAGAMDAQAPDATLLADAGANGDGCTRDRDRRVRIGLTQRVTGSAALVWDLHRWAYGRTAEMQTCYETLLAGASNLAGVVEVELGVDGSRIGDAIVVGNSADDPALADCALPLSGRFLYNPNNETGRYRVPVEFSPQGLCSALDAWDASDARADDEAPPDPFSCRIYRRSSFDQGNYQRLRDEDYLINCRDPPEAGTGCEVLTLYGDTTFRWTIDGTINARDTRGRWSYVSRSEHSGLVVLDDGRLLSFQWPVDEFRDRTRYFADLVAEWGASGDRIFLDYDQVPAVDPPSAFCERLGRWQRDSGAGDAPRELVYNNDGTFYASDEDGCLYAGTWSIDPRTFALDPARPEAGVEQRALAESRAQACDPDGAYAADATRHRYRSPLDGNGRLIYRGATYVRSVDASH